jgi:hypothetical protein
MVIEEQIWRRYAVEFDPLAGFDSLRLHVTSIHNTEYGTLAMETEDEICTRYEAAFAAIAAHDSGIT